MSAWWARVGLVLAVFGASCSGGTEPDVAATDDAETSAVDETESTEAPSSSTTTTVAEPIEPIEPVDLPDEVPIRYRVNTDKVAADTADPFLNVRLAPGASEELLAKLPANYRGLRWLGEDTQTADGGLWYLVELLDPVAIRSADPIAGPNPTGWVNSAYLLPLADGIRVGTDDVAACAGGGSSIVEQTEGDRPAGHIYALESALLSPRCLRTVITFGTGDGPVGWFDVNADVTVANSLPRSLVAESGASGIVLSFDSIESVWPGATDTDGAIYIVRDHGEMVLVSPLPVSAVRLTAQSDDGTIVIDMTLSQEFEQPASSAGVVALSAPVVWPGWVEISGIARPFEANLGVHIEDSDGTHVEAIYSGSLTFGTIRATNYAVQTDDWLSTWSRFAVRAEDLNPGDYTLVLDAEGGGEVDQSLRIAFAFPSPDESAAYEPPGLLTADENQLVQDVVAYARGWMPLNSMPFGLEVGIGMDSDLVRTVPRADLGNPAVWEVLFPAADNPTNGLEVLAETGFVTITEGFIRHCASPPFDPPAGYGAYKQINIQPIGIDSCLRWFGTKIFVDDDGLIGAITFESYEP